MKLYSHRITQTYWVTHTGTDWPCVVCFTTLWKHLHAHTPTHCVTCAQGGTLSATLLPPPLPAVHKRQGWISLSWHEKKGKQNKKITKNKTVNQINKNKQGADRSDVASNQRCKHTRCMKVAQSDAAVKNNQGGFHTVSSDRRNHSATQVALPPSYMMNNGCVC